jgi:hypothetical protein
LNDTSYAEMIEIRGRDGGSLSPGETHSGATPSRAWKNALDLMRIAREINVSGGLDNCVDVAIAFDHSIAGHRMQAPNSGKKSGEKIAAAYGVTTRDFIEFQTAHELLDHVVANSLTQGIVMAVTRRAHPDLPNVRQVVDGHVLNVVRDGRQAFFFDAQAGMPQTARIMDSDPLWDGFFLLPTDLFHQE